MPQATNKAGTRKLGTAPDTYSKEFFDDSFGKINQMFAVLGGSTVTGATSLFSGSGVPSPLTGIIGSLYYDSTGHIIYGPKSASGWGSGFPL